MVRFLFGILSGIVLLACGVDAWCHYGHPPVAVADRPLSFEVRLMHDVLMARIANETTQKAPIEASEDVLVAGAHIYREQCSACHGIYGKASSFGQHMYPAAPPLWEKHAGGSAIGVSNNPVGETYWKVANGIRLTGMPAYKSVLSTQQIWQVSLLLSMADKPLPPDALALLQMPPQEPPAGGVPTVVAIPEAAQ